MNKNILVTGGGGYIGSVLIPELLKKNYSVTALDTFSKGNYLPKDKNLVIITGTVTDNELIKTAINQQDAVIHLAGVSDGRAGKANPELTKKINLEAFKNLIRISADVGVRRFINMSTFGVYGYDYTCELTENLAVNPQEPYSETKAETEVIADSYNSDNFTVTNIRLAMVFGRSPQMRFDFLVNTLIKNAIENKELTILGGNQIRPQIHISDVARALLTLLSTDKEKISGQTLNLGTLNKTVLQIANEIKENLSEEITLNLKEQRQEENSFVLNSEKIKSLISFRAKYNIADAVKEIKNKYYGMDS